MKKTEKAQMFIGNKKVYEVLKNHFSSSRYCKRLIHTDEKTGEIVIENSLNETIGDLVNLSELYSETYVQVTIIREFEYKVDNCRYVINNGRCTKIFATYEYSPSYLRN